MIFTILGGKFGYEIGKDSREGSAVSTLMLGGGGLVIDVIIGALIIGGIGAINQGAYDDRVTNMNQVISEKYNYQDADIKSIKLSNGDTCEILLGHTAEGEDGFMQKTLTNVITKVDEDTYKYFVDITSDTKHSNNSGIYQLDEKRSTKKFFTAFEDLIVSSEYIDSYDIGNYNDFTKSLMKNCLYTNPTMLSDVDGVFVDTEFINNGVSPVNVSSVYTNEDNTKAYFTISYLETIGKDDPQVRTAKVTIEGKDLTAEGVYDSFIYDDNYKFSEISSTYVPSLEGDFTVNL